MNTKKLAGWVAVAFVLFFVISQPQQSADVVQDILSGLGDGADRVATFVKELV